MASLFIMENIVEIWKKVIGYEKYYEVSNLGNVKTLERFILNGQFSYSKKPKLLKPGTNSDGYKSVVLYGAHSKKSIKVHILVAKAFIDNPRNLEMVNHIDENKTNNNILNLEWVSRRENGVHRFKNKNTTSKYCGVSWSKQSKKWTATIRYNNKQLYLGCYHIEIEAYQARIDFEKEKGIINKYL